MGVLCRTSSGRSPDRCRHTDQTVIAVFTFEEATGGGLSYYMVGPANTDYKEHIVCSGTYGHGATGLTEIVNDGDSIQFYVPGCQNPGQITVKLTYAHTP